METDYVVNEEEAGQRLDVFCVAKRPDLSRSAIQKLIKEEGIMVNGAAVKPRYILKNTDSVHMPEVKISTVPAEIPPIDLPILYEDRDVVVVNKPAGINVHPAPHSTTPTVTAWFIDHYPNSRDVGEDPQRPGVVHRLDKETSGALILAKTSGAYTHLKEQFKQHRAKKEYVAWVFGIPGKTDGRITRPLSRSRLNPMRRVVDEAGKPAITEWKLEGKIDSRYSLLRVFPFTGRTHQIRVHMHFLGHPIVGDKLYNFRRQKTPQGITRQLLHAEKLIITLPDGNKHQFIAPLPADFELMNTMQHGLRGHTTETN
jgi:23S rRNA pseudouridine1911/1915/1917 synthase